MRARLILTDIKDVDGRRAAKQQQAMLTAEGERIRLHITPLTKETYDRIIPATLAAKVANVSLHELQTFPERGFGYVDMPRTEAEKLKKKLNGTTLKGTKIRIEEARPKAKRKSEHDEEDAVPSKRVKVKSSTKTKQGVLPGHELEEGRRVKRAWTGDPDGKTKDKHASKSTSRKGDDRKLLFRTTVPPNAKDVTKKVKKDKTKSSDRKKDPKDKRIIVEEFAHSRKSFVISSDRTKASKPAVEYVDGKGWVDEDGEVVEPARPSRTRTLRNPDVIQEVPHVVSPDKSSNSSVSSEHAEASDSNSEASEPALADDSSAEEDERASQSPEKASSVDVQQPAEVHPLEALYKKPQTQLSLAPIDTSFSFFGAGADTDEQTTAEIVSETVPQTPHTKQEFEWRAQRSAAPTPDTAAIDGRFGFPFGLDEEDDDESDEGAADTSPVPAPTTAVAQQAPQEESEFRKYFYEHRGENDRAWKKKRREAKKQQRQRENRRLSRRVV